MLLWRLIFLYVFPVIIQSDIKRGFRLSNILNSVSCFKVVFLRKAIMGCKLLNISLKLLSMLNMYQCLFVISFIFGSTGLYVIENGTESLRLGLQCFKSKDLSRWSTVSICFLTVDSLQPFSTNLFIRSWECFLYSSKVEHMRLIPSA